MATPRNAVLVVAHADGWLEVFADPTQVDAHIAILPTVLSAATIADRQRAEILGEEYLAASLPRRYRDVYWPSWRRAADKLRIVTPWDIAWRSHDLELLRATQRTTEDAACHRWIA